MICVGLDWLTTNTGREKRWLLHKMYINKIFKEKILKRDLLLGTKLIGRCSRKVFVPSLTTPFRAPQISFRMAGMIVTLLCSCK